MLAGTGTAKTDLVVTAAKRMARPATCSIVSGGSLLIIDRPATKGVTCGVKKTSSQSRENVRGSVYHHIYKWARAVQKRDDHGAKLRARAFQAIPSRHASRRSTSIMICRYVVLTNFDS